MNFDISLIISGAVLGLTAGLSPGPFQTLIISQTLKHGVREGVLVAFAPLITDLPIFLIAVVLLSQVSKVDPLMGALSLVGTFFIGYLAYGNFRVTEFQGHKRDENPDSIKKGVITNFLNPYPYMFWLLVGAPIIVKAYQTVGVLLACSFIVGFYICLLGTFTLIAGLVGKSRSFLKGKVYVYTLRGLGILLLLFALRFLRDSLQFFGLL